MIKPIIYTFSFFLFLTFMSCENKAVAPLQNNKASKEKNSIKKEISDYNKRYLNYESAAIDTLIALKKWNLQESKTGLRYHIDTSKCTSKKLPKRADRVVIDIEILDIYEKTIYPKQEQTVYFLKDYNVNGLVEALSRMCIGSKAKIIVPSHLGYGKRGDNDLILPNQVLIYNINVKQIK